MRFHEFTLILTVVLAVSLTKLQLSFLSSLSFLLQVFGHAILAKIIIKHHRNIFFERVRAGVKIRVRRSFFATKIHCTVNVLS